jgi:hypothetical protein
MPNPADNMLPMAAQEQRPQLRPIGVSPGSGSLRPWCSLPAELVPDLLQVQTHNTFMNEVRPTLVLV